MRRVNCSRRLGRRAMLPELGEWRREKRTECRGVGTTNICSTESASVDVVDVSSYLCVWGKDQLW